MSLTADPFDTGPQRDRWGRPLIVPPDGGKPVAYTRCTTYVGCLEDTYNLAKWQMRNVALGLADRPDLLLSVAAHRDDKRHLDKVCEDASEAAKAHAAATTGTALHALTESLDRGQELGVIPEAYIADIAAYNNATAPLGMVLIEQFCVLDELKIGGTPDRVVSYGGRHYIADLKTGSIDFGMGKIAMQLAVYSRSAAYDHEAGTRHDLHGELDVDQDRALVIHLPAGSGTCNLVWVDIAAGWEAVGLATQVRAWRARKNLTEPFAHLDPLESLIAQASTVDDLTSLWRRFATAWTPAHSDLAKSRKAQLI